MQPASGRAFTAEEDHPAGESVAILSDGLWRRRFAAETGVIGKTVAINNVNYRVIGIMPPNFEFLRPQDVFLPLRTDPASKNEGNNYNLVGRLKAGVTTHGRSNHRPPTRRIIEDGTHDDLVAHAGLYAEVFKLQAGGYR